MAKMEQKQESIIDGSIIFVNDPNIKRKDFTMVANNVLRYAGFSSNALALYILIAQRITMSGFIIRKEELRSFMHNSRGKKLGLRSFQNAWDELKKAGYLKQFRIRTNKGYVYQYELLEEPDFDRPALILVHLSEEVIVKNGKVIVQKRSNVKEEKIATAEDMQQVDKMDLIGEPKNIEVTPIEPTEEEKKKIVEYYGAERIELMKDIGKGEDDPELYKDQILTPEKREKRTREEYIPQIKKQIEYDTLETDEQIWADSLFTYMSDIFTMHPMDTYPIGGRARTVGAVISTLLKMDRSCLKRTICNIKNYQNGIQNYKGFTLSTLYNNIITQHTWMERNFRATYSKEGEADPDFLESLK